MKLWIKAWRESRARFLSSAVAISFFCVAFLLGARRSFPLPEMPDVPLPYSAFVWETLYGGTPWTTLLFTLIALILGLGGLMRERVFKTAAFTLALPVSRLQLVVSRATVGLLEVAALALIPALLIPTLSRALVHQPYPVSEALNFALLFTAGGAAFFAAGFLWSTMFSARDHTATAACVLTPFVYEVLYSAVLRESHWFRGGHLREIMSGTNLPICGKGMPVPPCFDPRTDFMIGLPWTALLILAGVTLALLALAARETERLDYF